MPFYRRTLLLFVFLAVSACSASTREEAHASTAAIVQLDLQKPTGIAVSPEAFGANFRVIPELADARFQGAMRRLNWPLLRLNGQDWMLASAFSRDAAGGGASPNWAVIDRLKNLPAFFNGKLMVTVGNLPAPTSKTATNTHWANQPFDVSNPRDRALYVRMVVRLAQHLKDNGVRVTYWDLLNEPDTGWYKGDPSLIADVCAVYNAAYPALKSVDPSYKVGGPVLDYWGTNGDWIASFKNCATAPIDFISYHLYGTNVAANAPTGDQTVRLMQNVASGVSARSYLAGARAITGLAHSISSSLPVMLTEYNISGAWEHGTDPRQATVTGAVFDAVAITQSILGGVSLGAIWETFDDGTFAVIDKNYNILPAGYLLHEMGQTLPGTIVSSGVSSPQGIPLNALSFATKNSAGGFALVLVNYDPYRDLQVQTIIRGASLGTINRYELSAQYPSGNNSVITATSLQAVPVPANSVVILTGGPS